MPKLFECTVFALGLAFALAGAPARADDAKTGPMQGGTMSADPMAADPMKADCMEKAGDETDADKKAAALAACDAMGAGMMMNQMAPAK